MVKWLPDRGEGRRGAEEAPRGSLMAVSPRVACIRLSVSVYICFCVWVNVSVVSVCVFARLVVCHPVRERPLFTCTGLSRGGTVCVVCVCVCVCLCVCVCVVVGGGVSAVIGFQRLPPKPFIFWEKWAIGEGGGARSVLYEPGTTRRGGSTG